MKTKLSVLLISITLMGAYSCSDDSSDEKPSSTNNNSSTTSIVGTYNGEEKTNYFEKGTNAFLGRDSSMESYTISESNGTYQLIASDNGTSYSLTINVSGNSFSATGPAGDPYFEGETYSGTINGNQLNMSYSGEDTENGTDYTYTSNFIGSKPSSGGGGSSNQSLTVDGVTYTEIQGIMDCQHIGAVFNTSNDSIVYYLDVESQGASAGSLDDFAAGTYNIIAYDANSSSNNDFKVDLLKDKATVGNLETWRAAGGQSFTITKVNGKSVISGSNIQLIDQDDPNASNSMSFTISCE